MNLSGLHVFLTGAEGFLGRYIVSRLRSVGCRLSFTKHVNLDLTDRHHTINSIRDLRPDVVIHAAANVGGIEYNRTHAADLIRDNLLMGINVLDACKAAKISKLIMIGSVCAYPSPLSRIPAIEADLWQGYPEPSNAAYGIAKRTLIEMGMAYHAEGYVNVVNLLLANLYGPGDSFDLDKCHVVPALVRRFVDAVDRGDREVVCWGDGTPTRDLLYVSDAANAVMSVLNMSEAAWNNQVISIPFNISSNQEFTIRCIADLCAGYSGFDGMIKWDKSKPNGQQRRRYDFQRAFMMLGWAPMIMLDEGIEATVVDYQQRKAEFNSIPASQDKTNPIPQR